MGKETEVTLGVWGSLCVGEKEGRGPNVVGAGTSSEKGTEIVPGWRGGTGTSCVRGGRQGTPYVFGEERTDESCV